MEETLPFIPFSDNSANNNAEATLVVQAQAGQTTAFDSLMRTYRDRVFGVVMNLTGNRADAADVTQDVFIKAFTNIRKYNFRASFFTWIYRIAVNEALNYQRKAHSKKASIFEKFIPMLRTNEGTGTQPTEEERLSALSAKATMGRGNDNALQSELQEQLDKAIQLLSSEHRAAIVLTEIEGLDMNEAAEILGVSEGTLKSRLHYAKKRLQVLLKPYLSV